MANNANSLLTCEFMGRPAIWAENKLFVLWRKEEFEATAPTFDYDLIRQGKQPHPGIEAALKTLQVKEPTEIVCAPITN